MSDLKKSFGIRLKSVRQAQNLTQEQLANQVDVTIETISFIERGIHSPRFDLLEKLAKALNTPVHEFFIFNQ